MYDPIKTSLGALHISSGISAFFLGCLVLQAYRYFSDYPRDSKWIKSLVRPLLSSRDPKACIHLSPYAALLRSRSCCTSLEFQDLRQVRLTFCRLSELALHMTITEVSYIMTIIHAGDPFVFLHISSSQLAPPLFLSVLAIPMNEVNSRSKVTTILHLTYPSQIFYYWRIYRLVRRKWPCIIATVLSCCRTCGWIYYLSRVTQLGLLALITDTSLRWLVILLFAFTFFLNSSIVLVMTVYLSRHRNTPIMAYVMPTFVAKMDAYSSLWIEPGS